MVPTVQACVDSVVAAIESKTGKKVPSYDFDYLRILAVALGVMKAELYQVNDKSARQNLVLTSSGDRLTELANEYGLTPKQEVKSVLSVGTGGASGVVLPKNISWRSRDNDLLYFPLRDYTFPADAANIQFRCELAGPVGDLEFGAILDISSTVENLSSIAVVSSVVTPGAYAEEEEELKIRVLDEIQTTGGGSNEADYRRWGQETPNVLRVEPYTGSVPWESSLPGERTVFVEATTGYDPDGLADAALLAATKSYILNDPVSGLRRPCLGSTDDTLIMESITRSTAYFSVFGLSVPSSQLLNCQSAVTSALEAYSYRLRRFILGLDSEAFRNDVLSSASASREVQRVVQAFGGYASSVTVGLEYGVSIEAYPLNPGERMKASVAFL